MSKKGGNIFLSAYGNNNVIDKGIIKLYLDTEKGIIKKKSVIPLNGKSNLIIEYNDKLITSVQNTEGSTLEFYDKSGKLLYTYKTELFYSYGEVVGDKLLLSSYASGADSVYDLKKNELQTTVFHKRDGYDKIGKSHYIHFVGEEKIVSVDNSLQQLYVYKDINLSLKTIIDFPKNPEKNIRLMTFHPNGKKAYLNTEKTNELLVLDIENFRVIDEILLVDDIETSSGGNAISRDGKYLCISLRGRDMIIVFKNDEYGMPHKIYEFNCGKTPRDLKFVEQYLLVSCTDENSVEVYLINEDTVSKTGQTEVFQPITFAMK